MYTITSYVYNEAEVPNGLVLIKFYFVALCSTPDLAMRT